MASVAISSARRPSPSAVSATSRSAGSMGSRYKSAVKVCRDGWQRSSPRGGTALRRCGEKARRGGALQCKAAMDSQTLLIVGAAIAGIGAGIGIPVFYSMQADASATRENKQPCFACEGSGVQVCGFCKGSGQVESFATDSTLGTMEMCLNCEGQGYTTCTTCNGTGIQPRYLDRREFQDDD